MPNILLSLKELSIHTRLPLAWIRREADAGRLPCIRAGRRRVFDLEQVLVVLADRAKIEAVRDAN